MQGTIGDLRPVEHGYWIEDLPLLRKILRNRHYHAVVANPPYITPKDRALNQAYRERYTSCHMKYSLAVPFLERCFRLAISQPPPTENGHSLATENRTLKTSNSAGFIGQITANSFMKREFGKKLIEEFLPQIDLTHVIDTSGAYIPGHGTPTVILFGRHRPPMASTVRTVMGIRGEPTTPSDPARGLVWSAVVDQINQTGSHSEYVSVGDLHRGMFHKHPWSIGGGGASELKDVLQERATRRLEDYVDSIGITAFTLEDDLYLLPRTAALRWKIKPSDVRPMIIGDVIRDWMRHECAVAVFPYDNDFVPMAERNDDVRWRYLWSARTSISSSKMFGGRTKVECGLKWYEYGRLTSDKLRTPFSIVFAFIASHNHFVLDRGGSIFNRSAPIIKLPRHSSEDDQLALIGFLNSSATCFSLKQISHQKQLVGGDGVRVESRAVVPYEFGATQMLTLPIPEEWGTGQLRKRLLDLTCRMDHLASRLSELTPQHVVESRPGNAIAMRASWKRFQEDRRQIRSTMILLQEEIDFTVYVMWDLADHSLLSDKFDWPDVTLDAGNRPFDILRGRNEDDFPVPKGIPTEWPADLRDIWQRRIDAIKQSSELRLIEDPHYKRRWRGRQGLFNHTENQDELQTACVSWLLDRLESYFDFDGRMNKAGEPTAKLDIALISVAKLADIARQDTDFQQVGELYCNDPTFDVQALVGELVADESVPSLPVLRYKESGLRKRAEWERTWELQRQEDAIDARTKLPLSDSKYLTDENAHDLKRRDVGEIPVPSKYISADFLKSEVWSLRGKLDVPKERWISFPHCDGPDGTPMIAWAGYDHLQQATAIGQYYQRVKDEFGGSDDPRLIPLLACLLELLPWLKQWHNEPDAAFNGTRMGDYFEGFVNEEAHQLGKTIPEIKAWTPPARSGGKGRKGKKVMKQSASDDTSQE